MLHTNGPAAVDQIAPDPARTTPVGRWRGARRRRVPAEGGSFSSDPVRTPRASFGIRSAKFMAELNVLGSHVRAWRTE